MSNQDKARDNFIELLDGFEEAVADAAHECSGLRERATMMAQYNKLLEVFDSQRKELEVSEKKINKLRGQLQNCVNHLHGTRDSRNSDIVNRVIEQANKTLYETLVE